MTLSNIIYHIFFLVLSLSILLKVIGYGLYEINTLKNKSGGIVVITTSVFVVIFSNVMVFMY